MRITQNTMMRQYNARLNKIMSNVNTANQKVTAQRKFLKASEAPSESIKAGRLYRQYQKNEMYIDNIKNATSRFDAAESAIMRLSNSSEDIYAELIEIGKGTYTDDNLQIFATKLRETQKSMILTLNSQFGDRYLFGGSSVKEAPFSLDDDGTVRFRGLDVNDPANFAELQKMADENIYIDIGFGMSIDESAADPNTVLRGSAFNVAMPGINIVGFGVDSATGLPKNIVSVIGEMATMLEQGTSYDRDEFNKLATQFNKQRNTVLTSVTQMGTTSNFLEFTLSRLDDNQYVLNERLTDVVYLDPAKAITDFESQMFVYNAALKMGSTILSTSLMDFLH